MNKLLYMMMALLFLIPGTVLAAGSGSHPTLIDHWVGVTALTIWCTH